MATSSPLTLSSATFAKLSPHPFLLANLEPSESSLKASRTNGRQPQQPRQQKVNTSSLSHAHGSALVRNGDTTVICGVRGETLLTSAIPNYRAPDSTGETPVANEALEYDLLVPNIELATGSAPSFLPGVPPTSLAQTLSTRVFSLLHSSKFLDPKQLRIYQKPVADTKDPVDDTMRDADDEDGEGSQNPAHVVQAYWVLYIDVLFISFDGNPFDTAWAAIAATLRDTKLPHAYWDPDREMVLCSRDPETTLPLTLHGLPVALTAAVFTAKEKQKKHGGRYWLLVDPDRLEESLCEEIVTVVVDCSGSSSRVLSISKNGGTVVGPDLIKDMIRLSEARWEQFSGALRAAHS